MCNRLPGQRSYAVLPSWCKPIRYRTHFNPCLESFKFSGHQTVTLKIEKSVNSIVFHAKDLLIESPVEFRDSHGHSIFSSEVTLDTVENTVSMTFPSELPVGEGFLQMRFQGTLNDQMAGFYRSGYLDAFGKRRHMAVTQLEAIDARRMFPCVDEPAAKAEFEISVTAPAEFSVISNMPESTRTLRVGDDSTLLQDIQFMPTPKMSTYLLALCVGQFEWIQATTKRGTLVRVLATPGNSSKCSFALDVGVRCLEWYEEFFNLDYPLPKLDMIAVPDFAAGAMENWGLVTYREIDLLCDINTVSVSRKIRLATTITHELAHQWFGNLVTMEWWDDLWLNEGFASFMQTLSADALFPEWKIWDQYVGDDLDAARALDGLRSSHPVQVPIPKAEDVEEVFDAISYCKGSCVVRMLYHVMGAEKFKEGMRIYMRRHAYKNTVTNDLWAALQEALGPDSSINIAEMMNSWTLQLGYPCITVSRADSKSSKISISQSYFVSDGSVKAGDEDMQWIVPLSMQFSNGDTRMIILKDKNTTIESGKPFDWVKVNHGEIAPIRVHYSDDKSLLAGLPQLPVTDQVGFLSDTRALARAGRLGLNDVLSAINAFSKSTNADVWDGIESTIFNIEKIVEAVGKMNQFEHTIVSMVVPHIERIGWDNRESDTDDIKRFRASLFRLVSSFGDSAEGAKSIRKEAIERVSKFLASPDEGNAIPDDIRSSLFRAALSAVENEDGGKVLWRSLKILAEADTSDQALRLDIYAALGAVRDDGCKSETLNFALSDKVKIQDFFYPIGSVRKSKNGSKLAWTWINTNFDLCKKRVEKANPSLLAAVIREACAGSVSEQRAVEIENRFGQMESVKRNVAQLVEGIRSNAQFVKRTVDVDI